MKNLIILILAALMVFFALPKLQGWPVSITLFDQINRFSGFEGNWFRLMVGSLELFTGIVLLLAWLHANGFVRIPMGEYLTGFALLLLLGTMVGALFTELVVRPGEDWALTTLSSVLIITSLFLLRKELPTLLKLVS
jgi:hypothetical protein